VENHQQQEQRRTTVNHPHSARPRHAGLTTLIAGCLIVSPAYAVRAIADASPPPHPSSVILDWERISIRTIYTQAGTPVPVGVPYLGFTSVAMYDAVEASTTHARSSEVAAAAVAAHDVLVEYFPAFTTTLDADLATSLAAVPAGPAKDTGAEIGHAAADSVIASRVGDGRNNPATDYDEVRRLGSANSVERTAFQTDTARFFNSNSAIMVSDARCDASTRSRWACAAPRSCSRPCMCP